MNLFDEDEEMRINLLPYDGTVYYYGKQLSVQEAKHYFEVLYEKIQWKQDEAFVMGKRIFTKRKVAWYGNKAYLYTYSNTTKVALPWIPELLELKKLVEEKTGEFYNACLLNLYHDGEEAMAWHSDAEKDLKEDIKTCFEWAGHLNKHVTFIMTDAEVKKEEFLEFINVVLSTGEIPGLLAKDEKESWLGNI